MTDTGPRYSQAGFAALTGRVVAPTMPNDDEVRHLAEQLVATTRELTAAREALALARYERDAIAQDLAGRVAS